MIQVRGPPRPPPAPRKARGPAEANPRTTKNPKTRRDEKDPSGRVAPLASDKPKPGVPVDVPRVARREPPILREKEKG